MRIAVLASTESWYFNDLLRAAGSEYEIVSVAFTQLASALNAEGVCIGSKQTDLAGFDAVLVRTMPPGSLEQIVFRMDLLGRLEAAGQLVINPPRAMEVAVDKYLATAKLQRAGLTIPRTLVCQTVDDAMAAFQTLGGDVVVKPLFGSEGRGITRVSDAALALRAFKMLAQLGAVLYLQEFIPHEGYDLRLLVVGEQVLGMRRRNPHDWRTNISQGAIAEPLEPTRELIDLARRAAAAVGAPVAGVDILPGRDGQLYTIEVNAVPGWKALARALDIDVAALLLKYLQSVAMSRQASFPRGEWEREKE